jgi:hypothetical protein
MKIFRHLLPLVRRFSAWNPVSQHSVETLLQRHRLEFRLAGQQVRIRDCIFCPKPTHGRIDNLYTLNVNKESGVFYCHRCTTKGNFSQLSAQLDGADLHAVDRLEGNT